jgi:hypothetical protein
MVQPDAPDYEPMAFYSSEDDPAEYFAAGMADGDEGASAEVIEFPKAT